MVPQLCGGIIPVRLSVRPSVTYRITSHFADIWAVWADRAVLSLSLSLSLSDKRLLYERECGPRWPGLRRIKERTSTRQVHCVAALPPRRRDPAFLARRHAWEVGAAPGLRTEFLQEQYRRPGTRNEEIALYPFTPLKLPVPEAGHRDLSNFSPGRRQMVKM